MARRTGNIADQRQGTGGSVLQFGEIDQLGDFNQAYQDQDGQRNNAYIDQDDVNHLADQNQFGFDDNA